jgi:hypothetical protein
VRTGATAVDPSAAGASVSTGLGVASVLFLGVELEAVAAASVVGLPR